MAELTNNTPTGRKPSNNIPEVRSFQFDNGQIGNIQNSVNMFRGNVSYRLKLLDLPGRNGLDINLTLGYESNVTGQVKTWNMSRPTGILGLGWQLPFQAILVNQQGSAAGNSNQFYLIDTDRANLLIATGKDSRGRTVFETQNFEFWEITYDPRRELWEVVKEDGTTFRYGGKDSGRDTVQWGVSWGNWIGASANATGQQRNAIGWNLAEIENVAGDRVTYAYRNHEQNVGHTGDGYKKYTKASYLETVTDVFGRTITFCYGDKIFDPGKGICEYQDPNKRLSSPEDAEKPDAYQNPYETKYLDHIDIKDADGNLSNRIRFDFEVCNYSDVPSSDPTHPFLYKRFLTGLTEETFQASSTKSASLPGYAFTYWSDIDEKSKESNPLPGALRSITTPDGGTATYVYSRQSIGSHTGEPDRPLRFKVENPIGKGATPRVWYGPDYTVITWADTATRQLTFSVHRWMGQWIEWRSPQVIDADMDLDSLIVTTRRDFFCLHYADKSTSRERIHLYRKDEQAFGSWTQTIQSIDRTAVDQHTQLVAGDDFVVFCNAQFENRPFQGWSWNWRSDRRGWEPITALPTFPVADTARVAITGGVDHYVAASFVADNDQGAGTCHFALFYRDPAEALAGGWKAGSTWSDDLTVYGAKDAKQLFYLLLSGSQTFFAATFVTGVNEKPSPHVAYELRAYQWDAAFRVPSNPAFRKTYTAKVKKGATPPSVLTTVIRSALVGNLGNLLRNVGGAPTNTQDRWIAHDRADDDPNGLNFAYGSDIAVIADKAAGGTAARLTFDPNVPSKGGWQERSLDPATGAAAINGDFMTYGSTVYYRGSDARWSALPKRLPASADVSTTRNRAPEYILCDDKSGRSVHVAFLLNGEVHNFEQLDDVPQRTHTPDQKEMPGADPAGPNMFVTFPADTTFDEAETLYLYRVTEGTVTGKVYASPIVQVRIDTDGTDEGSYAQWYRYDPKGVTYDVVNAVTQYAKVSLLPGSEDGAFGRTEYYYSNGVSTYGQAFYPPNAVFNFNHVLNGLLLRQEVYSAGGEMVSQTTTTYEVYRTRTTAPGATSARNVPYAWFRPVHQVDILDGVRRTTTQEWDHFSGLRCRSTTSDHDSSGEEIHVVTTDTYGYDVEAYRKGLVAAHILDARVQRETATAGTVTALEVTTLKQWESGAWAPSGTARWRGTGSADFDFQAWSDGAPLPDNWVRLNRIVSRSATGLRILEQTDVDDVPTSIVYDKTGRLEVAKFPNASLAGNEAAYYGFEPYEENPGWTLVDSGTPVETAIITENPNTGMRCLQLTGKKGEPAGAELSLTPQDQSQSYLFSCWLRAEKGIDSGPGAANVQVTVSAPDNAVVETLTKPIEDTDGQWRYFFLPIDLADIRDKAKTPADKKLTLRFALLNASGAALFVDDVRCSPLLSAFTANVYQPSSLVLTDKLAARGELMRYLYDDFRRQTGEIGPDGGIADLDSHYRSREGDGHFDPAVPNSQLTVKPRGDGVYDDFRAKSLGADWSDPAGSDWAPDPEARLLRHAASADAQAITFQTAAGYDGYGVRAYLIPAESPAHPVSMSIGSAASLRWVPEGKWELCDGAGTEVASADQAELEAGEWLLVGDGCTVLFFFAGRQVLAHEFANPVSGAFSITATDELSVRDFCAFEQPGLAIKMSDGAAREIQTQVYEGPGWIASAHIYDAVGREAIKIKPVRRDGTAFGYWLGLVKSVNWSETGEVSGQVADFYAEGGGGFSDDQGYPFTRTRFEDTPLSRRVEVGAAGKTLAIDPRVDEADRHTMRYAYGSNDAVHGLPAGKYFVATTTDPDGNETYEITNGRGQLILKGAGKPADGATGFTIAYTYNAAGQAETVRLPNAFEPPAGTNPDDWVITSTYDFFGRVATQITPDLGDPANPGAPSTRRFIYDLAGRRRFHQTPELEQDGKIAYTKYDRLGRAVEEGLLAFDWTEATQAQLQAHADKDPDWPSAPAGWTRRYVYDGDGSDPNALLRFVASAVKEEAAGSARVSEDWQYDLQGNILRTGLSVPEFDARSHSVGYAYNRLGSVTKISKETDGGAFDICYRYNNLGFVDAVGRSKAEPDTFARYTYTADSSVATETLNAANPLERRFAYNSPGWPSAETDSRVYDETMHYWPEAGEKNGYYDGSISAIEESEHWAGGVSQIRNSYTLDPLKRLETARGAVSGDGTDGTETLTYDANGNVRKIETDGATQTFSYVQSTDRLQQVAGAETRSYHYDLDGNTVDAHSGALEIAYDTATGLPSRITIADGTTLDFAYGSRGDRVLKRVAAGSAPSDLLYVRDQLARPFAEVTRDGTGATAEAQFVYGPTGLIAMQRAGALYFVVKDQLGSTRAVVDENLAVKANYRYAPFGEILVAHGDMDLVRYLFTGQEYDAETGLYNFNARLYDPFTRRFIGPDPDEQFASPYLYAANNPLIYADPSGRFATLAAIGIAALVGAIIGAVAGLTTGVVMSVKNHWSFGEALWRTTLFTLAGAAFGAISGAALTFAGGVAVEVGGLAANAIASALLDAGVSATAAWNIGVGTFAVVGGGLELGASVGLGSGFGAVGGATNAAIAGNDPAAGAESGAISGAITGAIGFGVGKLAKPFAPAKLEGAELTKQNILKAAPKEFAFGAAKSAVSGGIWQGQLLIRKKTTWEDALRSVLVGAVLAGFKGAGVKTLSYSHEMNA